MSTYASKSNKTDNQSLSNESSQLKASNPQTEKIDNRPEAIHQLKLRGLAQNGPQAGQLAQMRMLAQNETRSNQNTLQKKENKTGLPDNLKLGIENLSGLAMDDVKVHRNSDQPAQLNAHAYAQGTDIHLGPGQEKHLPHEAWHVVQQKQGRVKPTMQMKAKVDINDDPGLEKEADVMGMKAMGHASEAPESIAETTPFSGNIAQRDVAEDASTAADHTNEAIKVGAGGAALAEGASATASTKVAGIAGDFLDGANAFKTAYINGKEFWSGDPKEMAKGATALAEGSKGILAVIKASVEASGVSTAVKESAGTIIPGIGAAIGIFQNVMSMMQNQATWTLVDGLDKGTLNDKEKEKVAAFIKRLDAKLGLDIVDFVFNIAEFIAMFTGTGPAVALVHSCFNIFKGACELTHGYFAAKGLQADQRVSGGEGEVDRTEMAALDLHLKESNKDEAKPSKSIFGMVRSHGAIKALEAAIREGVAQPTPDEEKLAKDRELLALRKRVLLIDLDDYNRTLKPAQVSDPNSLFGKVDVPPLTEAQIPALYKIHMNVIRQIMAQAKEGAHGFSKLKAMTFGVEKDQIYAALKTKLGVEIDDSIDDWKLLSAMDPEQAGYFTTKTKTAIHVSSKRKWFSDDEIQGNLQKILIDQKDKFLPQLALSDSGNFAAVMDDAAYKKAIENKVKF
jgi:hypothetical protein